MLDALGQTLNIGDYILVPGQGNRTAEYGLIMHKIVDMDLGKESLRTKRLSVQYRPNKVEHAGATLTSLGKVVKILPPANMVTIFEGADMKHFNIISKWIHGRTEIDWATLTMRPMRP